MRDVLLLNHFSNLPGAFLSARLIDFIHGYNVLLGKIARFTFLKSITELMPSPHRQRKTVYGDRNEQRLVCLWHGISFQISQSHADLNRWPSKGQLLKLEPDLNTGSYQFVLVYYKRPF
jgi:hypothetical protein